uniref:Ig-like domain-containing protein n=1 Tax=Sphenodon punctatus TaxID=8508 RepID=A0A8D0H101_SPHPU
MARALLLLTLLTYCSGSLSQFTLIQPPSVSVSLGVTVKLACTINSGNTFSGAGYWYQQKHGERPRYIMGYTSDSDKHQASWVPSRFSGSKDDAKTTCYLTITNAQAEDEADYYCAGRSGAAAHSDTV